MRQIRHRHRKSQPEQKQHPILICDEAQLLPHAALKQLPLLLNFDMDSSHYLTLLLAGQPLLRRTLSRRCTRFCANALPCNITWKDSLATNSTPLSPSTQGRRHCAAVV